MLHTIFRNIKKNHLVDLSTLLDISATKVLVLSDNACGFLETIIDSILLLVHLRDLIFLFLSNDFNSIICLILLLLNNTLRSELRSL